MPGLSDCSDEIKSEFRALAAELATQLKPIAEAAVMRVRADLHEYSSEHPAFAAAVSAGAPESIRAELLALQNDASLPDLCPEVDAEGARILADNDVPLESALRAYSIGHRVQWEAWYRLIGSRVDEPAAVRILHEIGSGFFFDYADRLSGWFTQEYTQARDRRLLGRERKRLDAVRAVLAGADDVGDALGYSLDARHVALVGRGNRDPTEALREVAGELGLRSLVLGMGETSCWAWLARPERVDGDWVVSLRRRLARLGGAHFATGAPLLGSEGFRVSHRQAAAVDRHTAGVPEGVSSFEKLELELLCMRDAAAAEDFVERQLHGFSDDRPRSHKLRSTLRAYFDADGNATTAALKLGVHKQTIANRLQLVEQLRGQPVTGHQADLAVALRLWARRKARGHL